ncbi:hypothetical protein AB4K20DRAFT_1880128 [Rhizopus microsporus]
MKLYFELVFLVDNHLIRRTHAIVKLPTTPLQLKDFFNHTQSLFTWKKIFNRQHQQCISS